MAYRIETNKNSKGTMMYMKEKRMIDDLDLLRL
jgi:hypothetical protein